jgi:hypothetical protein
MIPEAVGKPLGLAALAVVTAGCANHGAGLLDRQSDGSLIWSEERRLEATDAAEFDQLGYSVSFAEDRALVGAYGDASYRGAAYFFARNRGVWIEEQKIAASDAAEDESFGWSVSLDGDRALIGAYGADAYRGAAYVFVRNGGVWTQEQKLFASDGAEGESFGWSVSLDGGRALVGAYGNDAARGAGYVFVRSGSSWSEEQKLVASDAASDDKLGYSVSLAVDRALLGALGNDTARGAGYVFARSGSSWTEEQKLVASDGVSDDNFGVSVSLAADRALVGAYWDDSLSGSAYVFVRNGSSWTEEAKLVSSDRAAADRFGSSVSLSVDRALIGAYGSNDGNGAAHVFVRSENSWTLEQLLVASDGARNDLFGWSVSLAADRALVGAHYDDNLRGAVYVFSPPPPTGDALGAPCASGEQCASGHCADGVCCDAACDGSCEACSAALKGEGKDGICECVSAREPSAPGNDSGCGCRAGRSPRHAERSWPCVALALLLSRRRRSAASSRQPS